MPKISRLCEKRSKISRSRNKLKIRSGRQREMEGNLLYKIVLKAGKP
jgi:hypothetical protein